MIRFIEWILSLFAKKPKAPKFPHELKGWGWVNQWMEAPDKLINTLVKAGCNATHIEYLSWGTMKAYEEDSESRRWIEGQFKKLLVSAKKNNIFVCVNLCNDNIGDMKYPENGTTPLTKYDDAWFIRLLDSVISTIDKYGQRNLVAIGAVSEWSNKRYERWNQILFSKWDGHRLWNRSSRPATAPAGFTIEHHTVGESDIGKKEGTYILGDTGSFISALGDLRGHVQHHDRLSIYTRRCLDNKRGFVFYCFNDGNAGIDVDACKAIGKA